MDVRNKGKYKNVVKEIIKDNKFIPICWGYESFSGGLEKSAILAMLMPHLNVGAQKWTAECKLIYISQIFHYQTSKFIH